MLLQVGKTAAFDFAYRGHALVTLYVQFLCSDWLIFDRWVHAEIYAASWILFTLFTLTAEVDTVLCQLVVFLNSLRNRACRNASLVNANFFANQMSPIICRWKLVKQRYCFGDNRRTKDIRKIKLCGLKACCVTSISCSISHNFPALKRWNEKSEA